jgi:Uma2 family endonuclease
MATTRKQTEPVTIEAFDAFIESKGDDARLYELIGGVIVMMSNPTEAHEQIASNIGAPLKLAMDKRNCRTYQGGMRVQMSEKTSGIDKTKPDVLVRCGPAVSSRNFVTDPIVVVEVLSPSTIDVDRGSKLDFYKIIPTMTHIVLAYQDQMRVEHYRRTPSGFELTVLKRPEDRLEFDDLGFEIDLTSVYFGVEL